MEKLTAEKYNEMVKQEEECLFFKSYACPVCYEKFKSLAVRKSKMISQGFDDDLRPKYKWVDPAKYEVVVCPVCGYGALSRYYEEMTPVWRNQLITGMPSFMKDRAFIGGNSLSYFEALQQYEFAERCNEIASFKESRKAYTALKKGWTIRGKLNVERDFMTGEEIDELRCEEMKCIEKAYDGFTKAMSSEPYPIAGMDEHTLSYLCAALANKLGKYDEALLLVSSLMSSRTINPRIKDKAYDLKELIKAGQKELEEANKALQ